MRDHGGDLDRAMAQYGEGRWIDLSTGINPMFWPVPDLPDRAWAALPTRKDMADLTAAAARAYDTTADIVPLAGAQAAIQLVPYLQPKGQARILGPTYNEHQAALVAAGWQVLACDQISDLAGADLAVLVNPNNPDGRSYHPDSLMALADQVGLLVVDESFIDPLPDLSLAGRLDGARNIVVLRSFGKFYGLAGLRLGFALTDPARAATLRKMAGPWPVCGPAIAIGKKALSDTEWQRATMARLDKDAARLDALAGDAGWRLVGGTPLFRTYDTGNAMAAQDGLAQDKIWSRIFPYHSGWLRLGLPRTDQWPRIMAALARG